MIKRNLPIFYFAFSLKIIVFASCSVFLAYRRQNVKDSYKFKANLIYMVRSYFK